MSIQQEPPKKSDDIIRESEELKTDPMSEKDEVKAAEKRTAKLQKKGAERSKGKDK